MMMAEVGLREKVRGRRSAIAVGAPIPGRMPINCPKNTPAVQQRRFCHVSAMVNPVYRLCSRSMGYFPFSFRYQPIIPFGKGILSH
jgi:hypothetical protein